MELGYAHHQQGPFSNTLEYACEDWCVAEWVAGGGVRCRAGACPGNKVDFRFPKSADTATWYYLDNFTLKSVGGEKP